MPCIAAAKALCEPGTFTMISCKGQPLSSLDNPKVPALPRLFQASGSAPARSSDDAPRRKLGPAIRIGSTPVVTTDEVFSFVVVVTSMQGFSCRSWVATIGSSLVAITSLNMIALADGHG